MSGRNSKFLAIFAAATALLLAVACAQTDIGITTKVKAKLAADSSVKAAQVHVETRDKVVTLSGTVDNDAARTEAVALARGTDGVTDVVDSMTVSQAAPHSAEGGSTVGQKMDDAAITAAVKSKLMVDSVVGGLKIDVDTKDGVVSLSGPVKSQTEKDTAVRIARETNGVKDVQDNLVVQSG
jgi:hyperosmotically inducible protein